LKKLLVIGGAGQLGAKIVKQAASSHEVYATYMTRRPPAETHESFLLDKTRKRDVVSLITKIKPDFVVDTAALHNVDYCETHPGEARAVNVDGTRNVAEACQRVSARMTFISTDYVFDGTKGHYNEKDQPNPINCYGNTKLEGEKTVEETCEDYVIARPSVIYSWTPMEREAGSSSGKPMNFVMWLIQKLREREAVKIVSDQHSSPTLADNLAEILVKLGDSPRTGIYHTAGRTCINRHDFSVKIARTMGLDESLISPITTDQLKQLARRPMKSCLDVSKTEQALGTKLLDLDEALRIVKEEATAEMR